jgi:alpha-glucosidase
LRRTTRVLAAIGTCLAIIAGGLLVGRTQPARASSYHTISSLSGNCSDFSSDEEIAGNSTTDTYVTWDASYIYIGWLGGGANSQKRIAAFDLDAGTTDDYNSSTQTGDNITYSGVAFPSRGQPGYVVEVTSNTTYFTTRTGSSLSTVTNPSGASNFFSGGSGSGCNGNNFTEVKIPRSFFSGGSEYGLSPTDDMGLYTYFVDPTGGGGAGYSYGGMPQGQISDGTPTQTFSKMMYFPTTDAGRSPNTYGVVEAAPTTGNIHWNGLFGDQSPFYMSPVEPVVNGNTSQTGTLILRFRTTHGDATGVNVNWYDVANATPGFNKYISMSNVGQDATGKFDIWQADASRMVDTSATKFYRFQILQNGATTWYNADGATCGVGSTGTNDQHDCQPPGSSNFWVIPGYSAPAWTKNAIFYQIFPDRFYNGNASNDLSYQYQSQTTPNGSCVSGATEYDGYCFTYPPQSNNTCPSGSYLYGSQCAFTHSSWSELPTQPGNGVDFYGGDLAGITDQINPYLSGQLGVTGLYLNPIFESPSDHKYDTQDYYTVDPHFGTNGSGSDTSLGTLTGLIASAHSAGMKVMLDGVFNHTGDWNCWFDRPHNCGTEGSFWNKSTSNYSSWYYFLNGFDPNTNPNNYCAWSGFGSLPQLNYSASGVRDQIYRSSGSVMQTYLKPPYNVDAWRLDVADNYSDLNNASTACQIGVDNHPIWAEIESYLKGSNAISPGPFPNALILGEYWQKPTDWLGGYETTNSVTFNSVRTFRPEWDSVMNYNGFNSPVSKFFNGQDVHGENPGTYLTPSAFSSWLVGTLADNNRDAQLSMLNSLTTHDTSRFLYRACTAITGNTDTTDTNSCLNTPTIPAGALEKMALAIELQMTYVGMPSIYYGDEIGTTGGNDPDNRRTFDWNQSDWNMGIFDLTKTLTHNRATHESWRDGSFMPLLTDDTNDIYAYGRNLMDSGTIGSGARPSDSTIVILNNDLNHAHTVTLDASQLSLTDGTQLTDLVSGKTYTVTGGNVTITSMPAATGAVLITGISAAVPGLPASTVAPYSRLSLVRSHGASVVTWFSRQHVVGFNVYDGSRKLNTRLVTGHDGRYRFVTRLRIQHLRLVAVWPGGM